MGEFLRDMTVLLLLFFWGCTRLQAQEANQSNLTLENTGIEASRPKRISVEASIRQSSNLIENGSHGHESHTELDLTGAFVLGQWGKFLINQGLTKNYQREEDIEASDTRLSLKHNRLTLHRDVGVENAVTGKIPVNKKSRVTDRLQGAIGLRNTMDIRLGQGPVLIRNRLSVGRNFHEYTINADGDPTIAWSLVEGVTTDIELTSSLTLTGEVTYITSRTYRDVTKSRIEFTEEIGIKLSDDLSLSLGHTNQGDLVSSSQKSSDIKAFNEETSTVYAGLNIIF